MSKLNMCAWSTSTCEIDLSSTSTALLSSFFSRVSSCEESVIQVIWQWTYWDMFTGHFVSQTETANRNKIVKAWRECEEILHTLRDHHTKVLHGGPLECIAEKWQDKTNYLHFLHRSDPNPRFPAYIQISANGGCLAFESVSKINIVRQQRVNSREMGSQ